MCKVIDFPIVKKSNIVLMPNIFRKLYEMYKAKQNDIRARKIKFLELQAFQYFYDLEPLPEIKEVKDGVDIPVFMQLQQAEEQRRRNAWNKTSHAMLKVIADNRINECFTRRVKQLKKMNIKVNL